MWTSCSARRCMRPPPRQHPSRDSAQPSPKPPCPRVTPRPCGVAESYGLRVVQCGKAVKISQERGETTQPCGSRPGHRIALILRPCDAELGETAGEIERSASLVC